MSLDAELRAYEDWREELERRFHGKFIVFKGRMFIGPFDTLNTAVHEAERWRHRGPLLIRHIGVD